MIDKQKGYMPTDAMKELIRDNTMLLPAISRFNIAFGFGDSQVDRICRDNDVDTATFLTVCNLLSGYPYDASAVSLPCLMDYLKRAHVSFLDIEFPKIRHNLIDAINYSDTNEAALLLMRFYDDYIIEVRKHMEYENEVIFPYVDSLLRGEIDSEINVTHYSDHHTDTAGKLKELKDIFIYHYKQKENARLSGALLDIMICERDMMAHFDVETRLLVPSVMDLERRVKTTLVKSEPGHAMPDASANAQLASLSDREKDIIRGIAQGKVNKEIADELCISVHTVATHRRNISAKLDIHSSSGITVFAIINHLVDLKDVTPM